MHAQGPPRSLPEPSGIGCSAVGCSLHLARSAYAMHLKAPLGRFSIQTSSSTGVNCFAVGCSSPCRLPIRAISSMLVETESHVVVLAFPMKLLATAPVLSKPSFQLECHTFPCLGYLALRPFQKIHSIIGGRARKANFECYPHTSY